MQILQGKYLKSIDSAKGALKGIHLKTAAGEQIIKIPKALRAIAQTEIALGDEVRVWVAITPTADKKSNQKKKRKASDIKAFEAIQIIPLSPKVKIASVGIEKNAAKKKTDKKRTKPKLTVQLCQKKNCCKKGGDALWTAFSEAAKVAQNNPEQPSFKVEAVGCLGGCKNGPNIRLLPKNTKHRSVKPSDIDRLTGARDKLTSAKP